MPALRVVVGEVIFVEDSIPGLQVGANPLDGIGSGGYRDHAGSPLVRPFGQGPSIGSPDNDEIIGHLGGMCGKFLVC